LFFRVDENVFNLQTSKGIDHSKTGSLVDLIVDQDSNTRGSPEKKRRGETKGRENESRYSLRSCGCQPKGGKHTNTKEQNESKKVTRKL